MPVGAIIGGAATLAGSFIGSKAQKSAANTARDTSLAVAQQNNALARDIYGQNAARLDPFAQTGLAANNALASLYGLGGTQGGPQAATLPTGSTGFRTPASLYGPNPGAAPPAGYSGGTVTRSDLINRAGPQGGSFYDRLSAQGYSIQTLPNGQTYLAGGDESQLNPPSGLGANALGGFGGFGQAAYAPGNSFASFQQPGQQAGQQPTGISAQDAQENAFQRFRDSTGYQFQVDEAQRGINSGYAASGLLQSGAALKALSDRRQSIADNSFQSYAAGLGSLANRGAGAASSVAGVGQNFVSNVSANNNAAGTAAANAALARGNINANLYGGIGNALGQVAGGLFGGSSYGK